MPGFRALAKPVNEIQLKKKGSCIYTCGVSFSFKMWSLAPEGAPFCRLFPHLESRFDIWQEVGKVNLLSLINKR